MANTRHDWKKLNRNYCKGFINFLMTYHMILNIYLKHWGTLRIPIQQLYNPGLQKGVK